MYMGFVPDAQVKVLHRAPVGDPTVYSVDGIEIALRRETAKNIRVDAGRLKAKSEAIAQAHPVSASELVEAGR
jgi:FeoA domain